MFLVEIFEQIFTLLQSIFVEIPLDNTLAIIYTVLNFVLQIFATLLGGEVDLPNSGGF